MVDISTSVMVYQPKSELGGHHLVHTWVCFKVMCYFSQREIYILISTKKNLESIGEYMNTIYIYIAA